MEGLKKTGTGNGKIIVEFKKIPKPDDAADALAVAICHSSCLKFKDMFLMK